MKTDPQNLDYTFESDATRNFEPWRKEDVEADAVKKQRRVAEELEDAMKSLENRTMDSKREMDILAALDEMKSMKSRHAAVSVDEMLAALQRMAADKRKGWKKKSIVSNNSQRYVKRIRDKDRHGETSNDNPKRKRTSDDLPGKATDILTEASLGDSGKQENSSGGHGKLNSLVRISVIKKTQVTSDIKIPAEPVQPKKEEESKTNTSGLLYLCQSYGSSDEED